MCSYIPELVRHGVRTECDVVDVVVVVVDISNVLLPASSSI